MECPYQPNCVVINLATQAIAFSRFVKGWTGEQIPVFLGRQGELERSTNLPGKEVYSFKSRFGLEALFVLDEDQLIFLKDQTT